MEETPTPKTEERFYHIVQEGVRLITDTFGYTQKNIANKLKTLNRQVSEPSLCNIISRKRGVGFKTLKEAALGTDYIVRQELGLEYSKEKQGFESVKTADWLSYIIPEANDGTENASPGLILHLDGRVTIQQKTDFISTAQKQVIEVGIRLKTFADYFISRKEAEYKKHIVALLKKGVNFKGYMLDPECELAGAYFSDRTQAQPSEKDALQETRKVVEKLKGIVQEFAQQRYTGSFEIFLYQHIPYNHFLVVDPKLDGGKMMVSHYIYGVRRAECPVWEFTRSGQEDLFGKYLISLEVFLKDSRPI